MVVGQLPRLGKRALIRVLLFTCNYVVSVCRGLLWVLGMGYLILLWHSLSLPYNYFEFRFNEKYYFDRALLLGCSTSVPLSKDLLLSLNLRC